MVEKPTLTDWVLEDSDNIDAENITPATPVTSRRHRVWVAIRVAMDVGGTKDDVMRRLEVWNSKNDPQISEDALRRMVEWAYDHWDTEFITQ